MVSYPGEGCVERVEDVWNAGVCFFEAEKWDSVWTGGFVGCGCENCCLDFRFGDRFPWKRLGCGTAFCSFWETGRRWEHGSVEQCGLVFKRGEALAVVGEDRSALIVLGWCI